MVYVLKGCFQSSVWTVDDVSVILHVLLECFYI